MGVVLAHDARATYQDPLLVHLHQQLTERRCLCLRFNFLYREKGRGAPDRQELRRLGQQEVTDERDDGEQSGSHGASETFL